MDGLFHGKPYEQMDDLGVRLFLETPKSFKGFYNSSSGVVNFLYPMNKWMIWGYAYFWKHPNPLRDFIIHQVVW